MAMLPANQPKKTVLETIEEADSNMYRTKHRYYLDRNIPENR